MDVSAIANAQVGIASYAKAAKGGDVKETNKVKNAEAAQAAQAEMSEGKTAYAVDISGAGKAASRTKSSAIPVSLASKGRAKVFGKARFNTRCGKIISVTALLPLEALMHCRA